MKRFVLLIMLAASICVQAQQASWTAMGQGLNYRGYAMTFYNGSLFVGGYFSLADGNTAHNIARWDGGSWSALGTGTNSPIYAMTVYHNQLYVAGTFSNAGGLPANRNARWNGSSWDTVGGGITGQVVNCMTVYNDKLYVGGQFTQAGNVPAKNIAVWNDTTWNNLGAGISSVHFSYDQVSTLAAFQGELYAGGLFEIAGTDSTSHNLAKWDGSQWSHTGDGLDGWVLALCPVNDTLYIGGTFTQTVSHYPANQFASWDGTTIRSVGGGVNDYVYTITAYGSSIYLGGRFTVAGNTPTAFIAEWNGITFSPVGNSGMDTTVRAIVADDGIIYACGAFSHADTCAANYIAKYSLPGVGMAESFSASDISVYPNPSNGIFRFLFGEIPGTKTIEISDATGRLVRTIQTSDQKTEIDLSGEAKGIYFCRIFSQEQLIGTKKILLN